MGFFDLNIPYLESSPTEKTSLRAVRVKLVVKAMEMGYTGIAYNRTMNGVMSDRDFCSIQPLSLSSLLKLAPSLSSSVQLHRQLLGVPRGSPFRQYTRLTVYVDSFAQGQALNSGNPVLKTYDLVAVRPLNQTAFEQACEKMEVDIIAIDFSDKLPFRLKLPLVKAAIGRGVYFEIAYSSLIGNIQTRRQIISDAKLLVDWTGGKNLIFSSSAPSVNELRGPNDVSNLLSLFGLSMQCAKATISKNCSTLLANVLRKIHFQKQAIRAEVIAPGQQMDSKNLGSDDWLKWDPISCGEDDLLLDELAKGFSASDKSSKTVKPIGFTSLIDSMPLQGFQVDSVISGTQDVCLSGANTVEVSVAIEGESEQSKQHDSHSEVVLTSLSAAPLGPQTSFSCPIVSSSVDCLKVISNIKETTRASTEEQLKALNESDLHTSSVETDMHYMESQKHVFGFESNVEAGLDCGKDTADAKEMPDVESVRQVFSSESNIVVVAENSVLCTSGMEIGSEDANVELSLQHEESRGFVCLKEESKSTENSVELDALMDHVEAQIDVKYQAHVSLHENVSAREQLKLREDDEDIIANEDPVQYMESCDDPEGIDDFQLERHKVPRVKIEEQQPGEYKTEINCPALVQSTSGSSRGKRRVSHGAFMFPFKRLLSPVFVPSKRKTSKSKRNRRI